MEEAGDMHKRVSYLGLFMDEFEYLCGGSVLLSLYDSLYAFQFSVGNFGWSSRFGSVAEAGESFFLEAVFPVEDLGMGAVMLSANIVGGEAFLEFQQHQNPFLHFQVLLLPPYLFQN